MILLAALTLLISPWNGPSLETASPDGAKYRLTVHGEPNADVPLRAANLPAGWVASFCTPDLCSPFRYTMHLNGRGQGSIEFQAIRTDSSSPHRVKIAILAPGAKANLTVTR